MSTPDIDEINKIRKGLGLPLLPSSTPQAETSTGPKFKQHADSDSSDDDDAEPASTLETREAAGYENYQRLQDEKRRQVEREKKKAAIQRARDIAARSAKLEGKGLGDADDDLDAKSWLKGSKKRQAEIEKQRAAQLAKELEEREEQARIQYTAKDLAGVRVAHEVGDFDDTAGEQILTLQDAQIGQGDSDEEEDVLENADLVAKEKLKEKQELKKKKVYDVHDEENGGSLLKQYDEKKRKAFTLDDSGSGMQERDSKRLAIGDKLRNTVSLDILKAEPVSDYAEIKIKKPKKSKKKSTRKRDADEDDIFPTTELGNQMELDAPKSAPSKKRATESGLNDDDDLAKALSFSRRAALKKQKRKPEDIAKMLREEEEEEGASTPMPDGGLTLDDTTNFLDNLSARPRSQSPQARPRKATEEARSPAHEPDEDHPMPEASVTDETTEAELLAAARAQQSPPPQSISHTGLAEEGSVEQGLGATLKLLRERGVLDSSTDPTDRNELLVSRQKFILEARAREYENEKRAREARERDRASGRLAQMSTKEREQHAQWANSQREHQSSIAAARSFNEHYKPDVQLKYVDEDGRSMDTKEAFKHLSHMFHGKGSGKGKTEKLLKKREAEKERLARGVLDVGEGVIGEVGRKRGEAGVRLG
jgi:U4/U6.U5 tri-snRNP-associated protein 1